MENQEVTWSAFLREPTIVEPLLKRGDVVLRRRDGEPLCLSRKSNDSEREALAAVARLFTQALSKEARATVEKGADAKLPWTRFLSPADRHTFISEFISQFESCADLGDFSPLGRLLTEWKNTASAHAEGLAQELKRPIRTLGARVPRPRR